MSQATDRPTAEEIVELLDLAPLEGEGGLFRQTWIAPDPKGGSKPLGTAILYLITPETWSALHRLEDDEVFHFYLGDRCEMVMAHEQHGVEVVSLGSDIRGGERVQHVVPAGRWQGTQLAPGGSWALLGTTMAPGFTRAGFELATGEAIAGFPSDERQRLQALLP